MNGRRVSRPFGIVLFSAGALIIAVVALGIVWWNQINRLSPGSVALFADQIHAAARDSVISPADLSLIEELQTIAASKESSLAGRSLCIIVGSTPLLRRSLSDDDRRAITQVRDFLFPRQGHISGKELAAFLRSNPQIGETFRAYRSTVEQEVARRRQT